MRRPVLLTLAALTAALALIPAGIKQPGLPMHPRGDEPTYLTMIASLLEDGDLRCVEADRRRLFEIFPFAHAPTLSLLRDDAEPARGDRFALPVLYPALAAPFTWLLGSQGPQVLNMLLLALSIGLGAAALRRHNAGGMALLFAAAYLLLSSALPYALWAHPEVLVLALVTAGLYLGWPTDGPPTGVWRGLGAGGALAAAACLQPPLALLGVPLLLRAARRRRIAFAAGGALGAGLGALAMIALAAALGGIALPAAAGEAYQLAVANPLATPAAPAPLPAIDTAPPPAAALARTAGYLLVGRHTGFAVYFPLALVALVYFLLHGRDRRASWLLLATAGAVLLVTAWPLAAAAARQPPAGVPDPVASLLAMPGNQALVGLYPLGLFLVTRLAPAALTVLGGAAASLLIGVLLFTSLGSPVAKTTVQAHLRVAPLAALPLELEWLERMPDYAPLPLSGGGTLWRRRDESYRRGDQLATLGGIATTAWLSTETPVDALHLTVRNVAPQNDVTVRLGDTEEVLTFRATPAGGQRQRIRLQPGPPARTLERTDGARYLLPLTVRTATGARPRWRGPQTTDEYVGTEIGVLGDDAFLRQDLYHVTWQACGAPATVAAGDELPILVRLRNTGALTWPTEGAARVRLGHRWRTADGTGVASDHGLRTDLARPLEAGGELEQWQRGQAPPAPGQYLLETDLIFENVAWFSARGADTCRAPVTVTAAAQRPAPANENGAPEEDP